MLAPVLGSGEIVAPVMVAAADPLAWTRAPLFVVQSSRSEEHTSELQSLMRISYAVFCLKKKKHSYITHTPHTHSTKNNTRVDTSQTIRPHYHNDNITLRN